MSTSSTSSSTMQDDSTSTTLSPSSQPPSPPFLKVASSPSDSSTSHSSSDQDEFFNLFNQDCDIIIPGTEDLFDNHTNEQEENWEGNLSAEKLDNILLRAEARLREQEELASKLDLTTRNKSEVNMSKPSVKTTYIDNTQPIARLNSKILVSKEMRNLVDKPKVINDSIITERQIKNKKPDTLSSHFNLPRTQLTPQLKRDLQLIHMRSILDPKRMYKKQGSFKIPEYSQIGTIIEGPTEFFSSRLSKGERTQTFLEETMVAEAKSKRFKTKYTELQSRQRSGKKSFYKSLVAKRNKRHK